ncbi:MAG: polymer-forming cytoskeletal protein [Dehalococcoidia bacterium]|nr:polymer-forming cytoskeletal protein [Dehalococcoidia bacterium]
MAFEWQKGRPEDMPAQQGQEHHEAPQHTPAPAHDGASILDERSEFDGRFNCGRDLLVKGKAKGEIECRGTLTIDIGGQVEARVDALNAYIAGTYEGTMTCTGRVELASECRVSGEVTAGTLVIQDGARISGKVTTTGGSAGGANLLEFERSEKKPAPAASAPAETAAPEPADVPAAMTPVSRPSVGSRRTS